MKSRSIVFGSGIILLGVTLGIGAATIGSPPQLGILARCFESSEHTLQEVCLQKEVSKLLKFYSAKQVLSYTVATSSPVVITDPYNCHLIGHTVGATLYQQVGSLEGALSFCSAVCEDGCTHGAVIAAVAKELGTSAASTTSAVTDQLESPAAEADYFVHGTTINNIISIGKQLCVTNSICHAVGHILLEKYGTYEPALNACDQISGRSATDTLASSIVQAHAENCYEGVFMEGVDSIAQVQLNSDMMATSTQGYPPLSCGTIGSAYSLACFRFLPVQLYATHIQFGATCGSYTGEMRSNCFEGIGFYYGRSFLGINPSSEEQFVCDYPDQSDRIACDIGVPLGSNIQIAFNQSDAAAQSLNYCENLEAPEEQKACYGAAFQSMEYYSRKPASCPNASDIECPAQLKDYEMYKTQLPSYINYPLSAL